MMQTQMECDSDFSSLESEFSQTGLETEYFTPKAPAPSSDEEDLESTSQSEKWSSEEAVKGSDTDSSNDGDQQRDAGSELSSPEKRYEDCSEDGNSDSDGQSRDTHLVNRTSQKKKKKKKEKRGKQVKTLEATDGDAELSSELDVVTVDQSPGTSQKPSQKKKKTRGKWNKTVEEGLLKKPVFKVKRPWSDTERSAVHKHLANFMAERRVPGKEHCIQCLKKESALDGRSWKEIKNFVYNLIVTLNIKSARKKLAF